jgi:hypothetical protein
MIQSAIGIQLQESNIVSDRVRITRAQLHEKVWAWPMTTLGRSSASRSWSRKICKRVDVPVPPLGYWTKLQNRALPTLVAALRSLLYSFAGFRSRADLDLEVVARLRDHQTVEKLEAYRREYKQIDRRDL